MASIKTLLNTLFTMGKRNFRKNKGGDKKNFR